MNRTKIEKERGEKKSSCLGFKCSHSSVSLNLFDNYIMCSSKETKGDKGLRSYIDKLCVVLKNGMEYLVQAVKIY